MTSTLECNLLSLLRRCLLLHVIFLPACYTVASATKQCLDRNNTPVDWFIMYKLPKIPKTSFHDGLGFYYMDNRNPVWTLSSSNIAKLNNAMYYTLQQVYTGQSMSSSDLYLMYNDESPDGKKIGNNYGHSKGILGFDSVTGFWLIHSAPKFPPKRSDGYQWEDTASIYGQVFFCVSFATTSLKVLATQLLYNHPYVYDSNVPPSFKQEYPVLSKLLDGHSTIKSAPFCSVQENLRSLSGMQLSSFAKCTLYGKDLYDALVAPALQSSLLVETWTQNHSLPSNCSIHYKVYNVEEMMIDQMEPVFHRTKDHSKIAISLRTSSWVCIGDINRISAQFIRGGGTLCFQNHQVWSAFRQSVSQYEDCNDGRELSPHAHSLYYTSECLQDPL